MTKYGADYLAGCRYQKVMIANHPQGAPAGIFLTTFNKRGKTGRKTVKAMVKSGKFGPIVVHLAPFLNSHNYPKKLTPQMKQDLKFLKSLGSQNVWPSPFCEHNHPKAVMNKIFEEMREIWDGTKFVNSIWKGEEVPEAITEIHIPSSKQLPKIPKWPYLVSFDGFGGDGSGNFTDTNIEAILNKYASALHIRWWDFKMNLKLNWKDKTPISQRNHKPDKHYILNRQTMMKEREGGATWPNTALYKPAADEHEGGSSKDGKAMCILPVDKPQVLVKDSAGAVIDTMLRFKPDFVGPPKGARYYSTRHAYQIAELAKKNTGSTLIKIDDMPLTDGNLRSNNFK